MNINEKLSRVYTEIASIAKHDDASVEEVTVALAAIQSVTRSYIKSTVERRVGSITQRVKAYFVRLANALRGRG